MTKNPETKVVLKQRVLRGSNQPEFLQRVATVYIDGREYRVSAPPDAQGDALDWVPRSVAHKTLSVTNHVSG
jgi:hypothetical protein